MKKELSRRNFLGRLAAGTALTAGYPILKDAVAATTPLPERTLGRTGVKVSILAFGCGSRWLAYQEEEKAHAAMTRALDLGITYLDTAYAYGDGKSETWVGNLLGPRRNQVFLATKIPDRSRDEFLRRLEGSLMRLKTDRVDLVHIHSLRHEDDLERIEAKDGALHGLMEAREQKMARFIGMTSHTNGEVMAWAIERHDLDCVQITLNPSKNGRFEELALPAAVKKNLGIIAMKVTGQEFLLGGGEGKTQDVPSLLRYSLSLPVSTAVMGMPALEMIDQNTQTARNFSPFGNSEMERLRKALEPSRQGLNERLSAHLDGPTHTPEIFRA
jgi:hypothetical protein